MSVEDPYSWGSRVVFKQSYEPPTMTMTRDIPHLETIHGAIKVLYGPQELPI